ncbi:peptidoglycan DD-metalloendopeptidase family protein [Glycocaulis profundi]|nr:peptidoglycan DD-metalloendopeptidase family protein [Glycocaulis profundi]
MSGFDVRTADAHRSRALTFFGSLTLGIVIVGGVLISRATGETEAMADAPAPYQFESPRGLHADKILADAATELDFDALIQAEHAAFTACGDCPSVSAAEVTVRSGQTFASVLSAAGVDSGDAHRAIAAMDEIFPARRLRAGQVLNLYFETPMFQRASAGDRQQRLTGISFRPDTERTITVARSGDSGFRAVEAMSNFETRHVRASGEIESNLYSAAVNAGATDRVVTAMAGVLGHAIDFRAIRYGDRFDVLFERFENDRGEVSRTGDILYVAFEGRGDPLEFFRFESADGAGYYNFDGESAARLLMKMPINGARISSQFGMRFHPIRQSNRQHNGTDFAAPTGTPIYAAGNGVVERADWFGGFGNYVRIRHANGYQTAYAHMNGFARGIRAGTRVSQGDTIGYVGTTGASTGPHLHYEVHKDGRPMNPMSLDLPTGITLEGSDLRDFFAERDRIIAMRDGAAPADGSAAPLLVAERAAQPARRPGSSTR